MSEPDISVVLCTYNRAVLLPSVLDALVTQETHNEFRYEIVVVDDASTDETADVFQRVEARAAVPMRYVRAGGNGVAQARNRGIAAARGKWVAFTDDDQVNAANWLIELFHVAQETAADCVGGAVELALEFPPAIPLTAQTRGILGAKTRPKARVYTRQTVPGTGNVMIKKSVFNRVGGFDDALVWGGEDDEFMQRVLRADLHVWFTPKSVVRHLIPPYRLEVKYYRWVSLRVGVAFAEVDTKTRGRMIMLVLGAGRTVKALLFHLPRLVAAILSGNAAAALEQRCYLWRAVGYLRQGLYLMVPWLFRQRRFFTGLKFRDERATWTPASS